MSTTSIQKPKPDPGFSELSDGFFELGYIPVGIDEAGRGSLAGPVVAAAVVLPHRVLIDGVRDSKKLSPMRRNALATIIKAEALGYAFGYVDAWEIDEINILQGTMKAMALAVDGIKHLRGDLLALVDGNIAPGLNCPVETVVRGDSVCHLIAAASILAKVERDAYMMRISEDYPEYGFAAHKGYGTVAHRAAIKKYGPCPIHRKSFSYGC